ncbi:hypothetical protein OAL78_03090 [Candidatus Pelagibacter sp.]|nr:hypothetical protein [Candidatus Pelagibacter sp.]
MLLEDDLYNSYNFVGKKIFDTDSLTKVSLKPSLDLFIQESLIQNKPKPIDVEVYTLVSGLPFSENLLKKLYVVKNEINEILEKKLCYWVKPENLGVEYCVLKWPKDIWNKQWLSQTIEYLENEKYSSFDLIVSGIQIHQDGCIIAKGYDNKNIREIRSKLISNLKFVPSKQSNWAHIPLGRILEPVSGEIFKKLKDIASKKSNIFFSLEKITEAKLIYETKWYMEKRETLYTKKFQI